MITEEIDNEDCYLDKSKKIDAEGYCDAIKNGFDRHFSRNYSFKCP